MRTGPILTNKRTAGGKGLETDPARIAALAKEREDENWRFRAFLKGCDIPGGRIDRIVHRLYQEVAAGIDCTACANCCRAIAPTLDRDDVERLARGPGLTPDELVERYLRPAEEAGWYVFRDLPCPFLADGRCAHYELRPEACRSFPHLHKDGFSTRSMSVVQNASVCPIVFNVYERLKREVWGNDDLLKDRWDRMAEFIYQAYCSTCAEPSCDVEELMDRFDVGMTMAGLMEEASRFSEDGAACANHVPRPRVVATKYRVEVAYADGRYAALPGWHTARDITRLWGEDVEYIEVLSKKS